MMKIIHQRCLTVAVLLLVLFGNCVFSQQQTVLTTTTTTAATTATSKTLTVTTTAATPNTTKSTTTKTNRKNTSSEILRNVDSIDEDFESSAEILSDSDDTARASITPTTYRPVRASIAPHTSAQERERKLMNVLAARRNALHRGGFRTRVGTTGRTAITSAIESTSKSPTDPRSICIRNCTKNFTRRTTASCMRQCANFQRNFTNTVVVKQSSKTGLGTQSERDTNEILFTDESSHGLFVVAKEQNDTANHIPETGLKITGPSIGVDKIYKFRARGKPAVAAVTIASTSIEDDDIAPYLYFGQKLPPIKPALLTITSVSDEHPKLLEVSVASSTPSTTTVRTYTTSTTTSTLSPVEVSRSRYKYSMRDRANGAFTRRFSGASALRQTTAQLSDNSAELNVGSVTSTTTMQPKRETEIVNNLSQTNLEVKEDLVLVPKMLSPNLATATVEPPISTPLIITVLSDEDEVTDLPVLVKMSTAKPRRIPSMMTTTSTTAKPISTFSTASSTTEATTTTTSTTNIPSTTTTSSSSSSSTTTTTPSTTTTTTSTTTTTTAMPPSTTTPLPRSRSIIEEDTERLRALGPSLTQEINTDEKTNLIIFVNKTSGIYIPASKFRTTLRPPLRPHETTTDSLSTILRTTILTSIRSTVNPRPSSTTTTSTEMPSANNTSHVYEGVVETAPAVDVSQSITTAASIGSGISSIIVADERDVTIEMRRMNMATYVLAGIGIFPLLAVIVYVLRNYIIKRRIKDDEVFDVCIADQQPISPVKKLDSKYHHEDDDEDEVDAQQLHHHSTQTHHSPHYHHHQQHQKQQQQRDSNYNISSNNNNNNLYDEHCSVTSDQEFDRSNIRLKSLLGEGNFGQVWKAEADDLSGHFGATRIVAVKTVRACSAQVGLKDEANIMRKLGSHLNVVTLLGACVESEPHMLIMEYAMRGRLLSLLRAARSATNILPASVPGGRSLAPLSPRTLAGFALDIACGMEYIAERRIVHRDLAARNVLLDHNGVCKICDFGMSIDLDAEIRTAKTKAMKKKEEEAKNCANEIMRSNSNKFKFDFGGRFIINHWSNGFGNNNNSNQQQHQKDSSEKKSHGHSHDTISRRPALPIRWMAPEALQYHAFTTETDVWAFGIVLWEIATLGSTPYSHITGREVIRNVPNGLRPDLPKEGRHEFYNLMARCWHKEPNLRPNFKQARLEISRSLGKWVEDNSAESDYMDVSGFSEDLEHGMVYFNHRISEFECEI